MQPGFVPRPRLLEGLDAGLARGLLLACAPAGFGKTALLADWLGPADGWSPGYRGAAWRRRHQLERWARPVQDETSLVGRAAGPRQLLG